MGSALARCYTEVGGITKISFEPPADQEILKIKDLGDLAIAPLTSYLDAERKNSFTQLFAVKFLTAIGSPKTFGPLTIAFADDQWEVTRAAALAGMFKASQLQAKPYVKLAIEDRSQLVRRRAQQLWVLYEQSDQH